MQEPAEPDAGNTSGDSTSVSDRGQGLRQSVQDFVDRWHQMVGKEWRPERVSALHEDLEKLAATAGEQGVNEIAAPALELTVYLCSFFDGAALPSTSQRQDMEQLITRLANAAGKAATTAVRPSTGAGQNSHRRVYYLRHEEHDLPGLATRLGQQGYIVRPFVECEQLLLALGEIGPDVLLVDDAFVSEVHTLVKALERQHQAQKESPLCLVLTEEVDSPRVLFAQRAGADAVISLRDPIAIVARIDELSAQHRALGYRVLIVEDDRAQARFCELVLRHRGMITSVCSEPGAVATAVHEFKPDLVLLDLYLPGGNGIEIAQQIREQARHAFLPIVLFTGENDPDMRFDAIRVGADDFITKPVKPRHLVMAVESRVRRARQLKSGQSPPGRGNTDRRGTLCGRDVFARELARTAHEEQEYCPAVALIALDGVDAVYRSSGFVATGTLSQQIAVALAVELQGPSMLCACGELQFLVLLHAADELALREQVESLRVRLEARQWLSSERLRFSISCLRLSADLGSVEVVLDRLRALSGQAQAAGGGCCVFDLHTSQVENDQDPQQRLVRVILRAPSIKDTAKFTFQPLVPLSGQLVGQYAVRMELKPPKSTHALLLDPEMYLPIAASLNLLLQVDHHLVRGMLDLIRERGVRSQDLRLFLRVNVASLLDSAFAPWLAAELRGHDLPSALLVLELGASALRSELARAAAMLEPFQRMGMRLALDTESATIPELKRLFALDAIDIVRFRHPQESQSGWEACSMAINEARSHGKIVVAAGIASMSEITQLLHLGVHYAQGEPLSGWLPDFSFDFAEATL